MQLLNAVVAITMALVSSLDARYIHGGMLYPRASESRQIQELNGMWSFRADDSPTRNQGFKEQWWTQPLRKNGDVMPMPVPSSYNDISTDKKLQYFAGWAWYDKEFFVPDSWQNTRVVLRIDSAHYYTTVWVNGQEAVEHEGGHLPFEAEVNGALFWGKSNRVTVAVNNTLTPHTIPTGSFQWYNNPKEFPEGYYEQHINFDFFNYAGIHRMVRLYYTPMVYVDDITIVTDISGTTGNVMYNVTVEGGNYTSAMVEIVDKEGSTVASSDKLLGSMSVANAHFWWPHSMSDDYGYRYVLKVSVKDKKGIMDVYRQPFGVRTVKVAGSNILINDQPFYCLGVGRHEDSDIRGKGLDFPLIARDYNMMRWLGINCYRTSHYPYAEEILEQADEQGVAIVLESPGIGIKDPEHFDNKTNLPLHLKMMEEIIRRDKNKPCIIMWSVANEPTTNLDIAEYYFRTVMGYTKKLDPSRLVTFVSASGSSTDKVSQFSDVICINRYYAWYGNTGHTSMVNLSMTTDLNGWWAKFKRPVIVTEYGADTVVGLHTLPSFVFTEDYQVEFLKAYHEAFDNVRSTVLTGEMVWNFADFMTDQTDLRVVGNKKGLLTRQRQPKAGAWVIRERYWNIIKTGQPHRRPPA